MSARPPMLAVPAAHVGGDARIGSGAFAAFQNVRAAPEVVWATFARFDRYPTWTATRDGALL